MSHNQSSFHNHHETKVAIQAGQQIVHGDFNINQSENRQSDPLDHLPRAEAAGISRQTGEEDRECLSGTRVDVLNQIEEWETRDEECIFWLSGMAGTGKSTIARTVARKHSNRTEPVASFFFSRGGGDRGNAHKFFTTIAWQLANRSETLKRHIIGAVNQHKDIVEQDPLDQWKELIVEPLSKTKSFWHEQRPRLSLVVDALDECDSEDSIRRILRIFTEAKSRQKVEIRVLLTSRPETPICLGFRNTPEILYRDLVLHKVDRTIVDSDIKLFFLHKLRQAGLPHGHKPWPDDAEIVALVERAGGLFIWAATVCEYICAGKRVARDRLSKILAEDSSSAKPEERLNRIYETVLSQSVAGDYVEEEKEGLLMSFQHIVGSIVVLHSPQSQIGLSRLLKKTTEDVAKALDGLQSVLNIPDRDDLAIGLLHPSFRDFLIDEQRCTDKRFLVSKMKTHKDLASSCLALIHESQKRDICKAKAPGFRVDSLSDMTKEQHLPAELQYACRYWFQHLKNGGCVLDDSNVEVIQFFQRDFLFWLEVLGLIRKVSEAVLALKELQSLMPQEKSLQLYDFVSDGLRFILHNRSIIEEAPLQLYCSNLIFTPEQSRIRNQFRGQRLPWVKRWPKVREEWSPSLLALEGHSRVVNAVAFSPDGKLVASASSDNTVKLWNAATGACHSTLEGHLDRVRAVVFSPDGKLVASALSDNTVRLWDAVTGACYSTLKGHSRVVNAVTFSPDGKLVASASSDKTVRLWDTAKRACRSTLEGHLGYVSAVVFSLDGKQVASASSDKIVKLWDAATGACHSTLKGHSRVVNAVAFSPDGKLVASASSDNTVRLWDTVTGACRSTLEGHSRVVNAVTFSPDGKLVASASSDNTVRLWDIRGNTVKFIQTSGPINRLSFSPDGSSLTSNRGLLQLRTPLRPVDNIQTAELCPISISNQWIKWGEDDLLWLPPEYRPSATAVEGTVVVMGLPSGQVIFLEIDDCHDLGPTGRVGIVG